MSKEIKIGLSVIGGLLLILGGALYWRLSYSKPGMVVDAELLQSSDKIATSTSSKSAAQDQLADASSSANHWTQPAEQSGANYRRVSALGASGETDDAQSAYATNVSDDAAADQPTGDQQANVTADSDAAAANPFQTRPAAAVTSSSQTDATDDAAPQQFDSATVTESPLANQSDPSTAADTTGDHPSAIPVAAREPIAPARSIARNSKTRPAVAQTNQQVVADETTAVAERPRRSYLQEEESPMTTNGSDAYESSVDAAPANGVSSRVEVADGKYTVQPNDNYWVISEKLYGNAGYFKALQAFNRSRFPQHASELAVGDTIAAPAADELMKAYPNLCPKPRKLPPEHLAKQAGSRHPLGAKVYVVEEGDTLFDVARYKLGKASRWSEIYDLNRDVLGEDFDYLKPGTQLVLPTERRTEDRMTRQPTTRKLR